LFPCVEGFVGTKTSFGSSVFSIEEGKSSIFSPLKRINPRTVPTGTRLPSLTSILPRTPSVKPSTAEFT